MMRLLGWMRCWLRVVDNNPDNNPDNNMDGVVWKIHVGMDRPSLVSRENTAGNNATTRYGRGCRILKILWAQARPGSIPGLGTIVSLCLLG